MLLALPHILLWCLPLCYLLAGVAANLFQLRTAWRWATALAVPGIAAPVAAGLAAIPSQAAPSDPVALAMCTLVAVLGWVIVRFSRRYLEGEPGQRRYLGALTVTLASASVVAITDHLGVLALAWLATSVGLHHLLTFYRNRVPAQIVARKKFLVSRLADLCLAGGLALIHTSAGTLSLHQLAERTAAMTALPVALHTALALVALAAILKSAQLPVHGWLIQVMEAPTPVSALLHAGIVNLGGFVLIRLAVPLAAAPVAQAMLVVVGSMTAVLAGLVTLTRVSVKVRLAWSTCAQMGFMLVECGLGLYDLAFLHLIGHSLYKAYAFLSSGEAVLDTRRGRMLPPSSLSARAALAVRLLAAPVAIAIVALSRFGWQAALPHVTVAPIACCIAGLGLAPLLWGAPATLPCIARPLGQVLVLAQLYLGWHVAFGELVGAAGSAAPAWLGAWTALCFLLLYGTQAWLLACPHGRLSARLYPWAYHGFYLDEVFTRLIFRAWPVRLPSALPSSSLTVSGESA